MPGSQKWVFESVLDGANLFSFSHENCEELKRFAPSKTDSETRFDSQAYVGISTIIC